jgi:hypothetical protein
MSSETTARGLVPESWVETAEGPVVMSETPNKGFAVLTRLPSGELGFRQLIKLVTRGPVPLVRVVLGSGQAVVVGRDHPFYRVGMEAVPAADLVAGDSLETAYRYPEGYGPPDLPADVAVSTAIQVVRIEPVGEGEVMTGTVRDTHALFLTAGVLCGE